MSIIFDQQNYINPISHDSGLDSVPKNVKQFFQNKGKQNLIVFLIDGMGFNLMEELKSKVLGLSNLLKSAEISKLLAPFPTTTVANMTMMHTGLRPAQTGMFEWRYFEPLAQKVILPIRYVLSESSDSTLLKNLIPNPKTIFPGKNLYKELINQGVRSYVLMNSKDVDSDYTSHICEGANVIKHRKLDEISESIRQIKDQPGRKYIFVYVNNLDDAAHKYGLRSDRLNQAAEEIFEAVNESIKEVDFDNTEVFLTADHGLVDINPDKVIYLNKLIPELENYFKVNKSGEKILPAGSSRDCFLYINQDKLDEVAELIQTKIGEYGQVVKTEELLKMGTFGLPLGQKLLDRIGNLVVLPKLGEAIWWLDESKKYYERKFANHGGMSVDEVYVPLLKLKPE